MPKLHYLPGTIKTLSATHIEPYLKSQVPVAFDSTHTISYPYTWQPNKELSFQYTSNISIAEILLDEIYRYGDSTNPGDYPYSSFILGSEFIDISDNKVFLSYEKQYRLFLEDSLDEFIGGETVNRTYSYMLGSGESLYGHSNTVTSHILHPDAAGKKIILKGYTINDKTITVTYKSEETTPFTLNKYVAMEPEKFEYSLSARLDNLAVSVAGNKIFICGESLFNINSSGDAIDSLNFVHLYDRDVDSNTVVLNNNESTFNNIINFGLGTGIGTGLGPVNSTQYISGFSATSNVYDANEYFLSIMCGYHTHMMFMYDSSTDTWSNKDDTYTNSDFFTNYSATAGHMVGKKPLDTKHFSSTGNVHALITCSEGDYYAPVVYYSDSNMETWTKVFDETNLTTSLNLNVYGQTNLVNVDARKCITMSKWSKIIDEDTFFSEFCTYVSTNEHLTTSSPYTANFLIKTVDGGSTWTDVMKDHPEYAFAGSVRNHISDDGSKIYSMIFYKLIPTTTAISSSAFPIIYDADTMDVLFNYSSDGGSTWKYPSGSWSKITGANILYTNISQGVNTPLTVDEQTEKNKTMIYPHNETGEIIALFKNSDNRMAYFVSKDGGDTWDSGYGKIYNHRYGDSLLQRDIVEEKSLGDVSALPSAEQFDANDSFAAYVGYYGNISQYYQEDYYSVSDYMFESLGGGYGGYSGNYLPSSISRSSMYIPTTVSKSKVAKIKGYYI